MPNIYLINKHGRRVSVRPERKEALLKAGYTEAPAEKPADTPAEKPAEKPKSEPSDLEKQLGAMTKAEIVAFAEAEYSLELDESDLKDDLILAVLEAADAAD